VSALRIAAQERLVALPSWRSGPARSAIVDFVERVTTTGSPTYVAPAERVAVFDNDGTLWCEQPIYTQVAFALDRVKALAPEHPEWQRTEPFRSLLAGDLRAAASGGEKGAAALIAATHAGMTTDEFTATVRTWIARARHPKLGRPYDSCVYQPMLELLAYLRDNGFSTFIVSGGGADFVRAISERRYGIPPERVIGSTGKVVLQMRDGTPVLVKQPAVEFVDDGQGKPVGIHRAIGRRPVMAFGNSDGDLQMLQWTAAGDGPRFCLLVHHTDAEREFAYDRASHFGKLDAALDEATRRGWTVADIERDWARVFPAP
jgi:phosphoserine phosphatase